MKLEKELNNLERGLISGIIPGKFLIKNASNPDWYPILLKLFKRARNSRNLREMLRGIIKCAKNRKGNDSGKKW